MASIESPGLNHYGDWTGTVNRQSICIVHSPYKVHVRQCIVENWSSLLAIGKFGHG